MYCNRDAAGERISNGAGRQAGHGLRITGLGVNARRLDDSGKGSTHVQWQHVHGSLLAAMTTIMAITTMSDYNSTVTATPCEYYYWYYSVNTAPSIPRTNPSNPDGQAQLVRCIMQCGRWQVADGRWQRVPNSAQLAALGGTDRSLKQGRRRGDKRDDSNSTDSRKCISPTSTASSRPDRCRPGRVVIKLYFPGPLLADAPWPKAGCWR